MRPLLRITALLCALAFTLGAPALAHHGSTQRENRTAAGWPVSDFTLVDHLGKEFTQDRLQGRWTFVLVGDTRCGDPCTTALSALDGLVKRITGTAAVKTMQVLFISLDPERDTAPRLRQYVAAYGERFIGASGARPMLKQLADEMGVAGAVTAAPGLQVASAATQTKYTGSLVLIGPDGVIRVEYLPPFDVKRLTAEFLKARARG
ncbi:MAG TPA: SCO family protein [Burkholderiaceae bacterium]|nr:SCO family protein [Burkholderiaceae bacterium]